MYTMEYIPSLLPNYWPQASLQATGFHPAKQCDLLAAS